MSQHTSDAEHFFLALTEAADRTRDFVDAVQAKLGLTAGEYALLRVVENHPGIVAAEAGERLRITGPSVAEVVARLERKGLIRRLPDPTDARRRKLRLTASGRQLVTSGKKATINAIRALKVPQGDLSVLTHSLRSFLSSLPSHGDR